MKVDAKNAINAKLASMHRIPSLPTILQPLLNYLQQPPDRQDMHRLIDLISQDNSITAQCLHMANSPLFGRAQHIDTIRGAVLSLGIRRMQDIAMSCCVLRLSPSDSSVINPTTFWEHSFACALLSQRFAQKIGYPNPEKAYLAGLLHDFGIVVHLWVLPHEFAGAVELAKSTHIPLHEAEMKVLGVTHCQSGVLLAERWKFGAELIEVIQRHHNLAACQSHRALVAIVALNDLLCRLRRLGYGYEEEQVVDFLEQPGAKVLLTEFPSLQKFDWARFTFELEGYVQEVQRLVLTIYKAQK
jgi:putative nucleotidyltransferase with HDIG domain